MRTGFVAVLVIVAVSGTITAQEPAGSDPTELARLRKQVDELKRETEARANQIESAQAELRRRSAVLERQLVDSLAVAKRMEKVFAELEAVNVELRKVNERVTKQRDEAQELVKEMISELEVATKALEALQGSSKALLSSLDAAEPAVRRWGATTLGDLGSEGSFAQKALERLQEDKDPTVRSAASAAITKIRAAVSKQRPKDAKN